MRPKVVVDPGKQDGVVHRIPCECKEVYIKKTGRLMEERERGKEGGWGWKNTTGIYDSPVARPQRFLNSGTRPASI